VSFLAPLFLAGALAVAGPIILHLIRRSPSGRVRFSSLMFLRESPPRITRRSRVDDWLLLAVRAAAISLLAFAFARPFLREAASASPTAAGRRVAILLDTSASMRRADLWPRALARVEAALDGASAADEIALFTFDDRVREVVPPGDGVGAAAVGSRERVRSALASVRPGWGGTDLGAALVQAADSLDATRRGEISADVPSGGPLEILLVSDLQEGSRLDALDVHDWPEGVRLSIERVSAGTSNASLALLAGDPAAGALAPARARVSNEAGGSSHGTARLSHGTARLSHGTAPAADRFTLRWADASAAAGEPVSIQVPPGESRVVPMPRPGEGSSADRLVLGGDSDGFDNTCYVLPPARDELTVIHVGGAASSDASGPRYYLERALSSGAGRRPRFIDQPPDRPLVLDSRRPPPPVVVTARVEDVLARSLVASAGAGGTVLVLVTDDGVAGSLPGLLECEGLTVEEAGGADYAMLTDVDLEHPVFAPFAERGFGDFTSVRFWRHRRIRLDPGRECGIRVLARFDGGDPAVLEKASGRGRILVLASGWQPRDSQLALSTKFVPFIAGIIERDAASADGGAHLSVNDPLPLPAAAEADGPRSVRKPDGTEVELPPDAGSFGGADEPGIYMVKAGSLERRFAVNVAPREQRTEPLAVEDLEARGVRLGSAAAEEVRTRQLRDVELERSQSLWKWILAGVLGLLSFETWLAARQARRSSGNPAQETGKR
jgi:hypothetical protein